MFTSNWSLYKFKNAFLCRCNLLASSCRLPGQSSPLSCKFARSANRNTDTLFGDGEVIPLGVSSHCFVQYHIGLQTTTSVSHTLQPMITAWYYLSFLSEPFPLFWGDECAAMSLDGRQMWPVLCSSPARVCKTQSDCSWQTRSLYFFLSGKQNRCFIHYDPDYAQSSILSAQFKSKVI